MLIDIKLAEAIKHIDYCVTEYQRLIEYSYPNQKGRIQLCIAALQDLKDEAQELTERISNYQEPSNPAFDTWQQLYQEVRSISRSVETYRLHVLPLSLASTKYDSFFASFLTAIHREVGLDNVNPVVSLYQTSWFAVWGGFSEYPLYLLPASIISDLTELPLIFHEIGHVLFNLWADTFPDPLIEVVDQTLERKRLEIEKIGDPKIRNSLQPALAVLKQSMFEQLEEVVCDIVGGLLGGPAFCMALTLGLWITDEPFRDNGGVYPPLDYRIRVVQRIMNYFDIENTVSDTVRAGWAKLYSIYKKPRDFDLFYDDQYLDDMIQVVAAQLEVKQLKLYNTSATGIRKILNESVIVMLEDHEHYSDWMNNAINTFMQQYGDANP